MRLRATAGLAIVVAGLLGGCAGPERRDPPSPNVGTVEAAMTGQPAKSRPAEEVGSDEVPWIDPEALLPDQDSEDDVVARVGDVAIHKRHLYEYLSLNEPAAPRQILDVITLDAQVARAARAWGVQLDEAEVAEMATEQESSLREEVLRQLAGRVSFGGYLRRQFGMGEAEYSRWLRTKIVRELYRQYVLRFAAMREDRVAVRYIVNSDPTVLEEVSRRVAQGASFATLAIRHTEDENRMDGGSLPPFGAGFDHPVAEVALELAPGELSEIFLRESQGSARYYLVYCLRRIEGRDVAFVDVAEELRRAIDEQPLSPTEFRAASMSLQAAMESLSSEAEVR